MIHFLDAGTGWAEALGFLVDDFGAWLSLDEEVVLRTSDGGRSWRRHEPHSIFHDYNGYQRRRTHFISPTLGWKLGDDAPEHGEPGLTDDIKFYYSDDGGVTWQSRRGIVSESVWLGEAKPIRDIGIRRRLRSTHIHFIDELFGWIIGYTDVGWERGEDGEEVPWVGHFLYSTRDGGHTWICQVQPFPWVKADIFFAPSYLRPVDIDFVNRERGWIAGGNRMYRTTDGGMSWEWVTRPDMGQTFSRIDFVDESRGWAVGEAVWFTSDAGQTWIKKFPGVVGQILADMNNVWVAEYQIIPPEAWRMRILHSLDDGNSWQVEWEGLAKSHYLTYLGYHEVTQTLWAGGLDGAILKRTAPTTAVTPVGKLATLWGKLKAGQNTKR